jgi:hypothetical protein
MRPIPEILSCLAMLMAGMVPEAAAAQGYARTPPMRIGMIGLDTSHVIAFARIFNDRQAVGDLAGFAVVAGYPGGTDMPASRNRELRLSIPFPSCSKSPMSSSSRVWMAGFIWSRRSR